jgi:hypothetical protein
VDAAMIELLIYSMMPFVAVPPLALLPPVLLGYLALRRFRSQRPWLVPCVVALVWSAYAAWEISFKLVPAREWIRIDLILISPVLLCFTALALISAYRHRTQG